MFFFVFRKVPVATSFKRSKKIKFDSMIDEMSRRRVGFLFIRFPLRFSSFFLFNSFWLSSIEHFIFVETFEANSSFNFFKSSPFTFGYFSFCPASLECKSIWFHSIRRTFRFLQENFVTMLQHNFGTFSNVFISVIRRFKFDSVIRNGSREISWWNDLITLISFFIECETMINEDFRSNASSFSSSDIY